MAKAPAKTDNHPTDSGEELTDEDIMKGSPHDTATEEDGDEGGDEGSNSPEVVEFRHGQDVYQLPKQVVDLITGEQARADELEQKLRTTNQTPAPKKEDATPGKALTPEEQLAAFFENPSAFIQNAMKGTVDGLVTNYRQETAIKEFFTNFYGDNKDLAADKEIVELMFQKHQNEILDLVPAKAAEKLAKYSREFILGTVQKHGTPKKAGRAKGESPSARREASTQEPERPSATVHSLGASIRERRRIRSTGSAAS